jgi:predicted RNase H-like HicB family nuclease
MTPDLRYEITIYWSAEDHAYLAEVPELPGCIADGSTYEAALAEALRAVEVWIETARELGREVPEPKSRPQVL